MLFRTVLSLGMRNVLRVVAYRVLKRVQFYRWRTPAQQYRECDDLLVAPRVEHSSTHGSTAVIAANEVIAGRQHLFGGEAFETGNPPNWMRNPLTGAASDAFARHWSLIPHFDLKFGDIKLVWELSRFAWLVLFARAYIQSGESRYIDRANEWVDDWMQNNPVNMGPNWMCGQETAIRLNHTLLANELLNPAGSSSTRLNFFVTTHCQRIEATLQYAKGQSNNHVISEALGLIMGGTWLEKRSGVSGASRQGRRWREKGTRILEDSVNSLVMTDGSFAQYSTVYHRLLMDTLSIAEWWRLRTKLEGYSSTFYKKAQAATEWLHSFVDADTGDVPNLGGNDGALVYSLSDNGHRDFRPTVQLAGFLFCRKDFYGMDRWGDTLRILGLEGSTEHSVPSNQRLYPDGGFAVVRNPVGGSRAYLRFPNFKFRPSQSDLMHVDLWSDGINILRDGGTYGYASNEEDAHYFGGVQAHNTCQFDGRDQMPRLGRFLYGNWPATESVQSSTTDNGCYWSGRYTDYRGCSHARSVSCEEGVWKIIDDLSGFKESAVLRWRVCPDVEWSLNESSIESSLASLSCSSESQFSRVELSTGWESRYYFEKTALPVLEVELGPGEHRVITTIKLRPSAS